MKKISRKTIEEINRLSADTLEGHGVIERARNGGYICPNPDCQNGSGKDGTGISPNKKVEDFTCWTCYKCGRSFNNLRVFAWHYELDLKRDFNQLVEKICADFDISIEYEDFDAPKRKRRKKSKFAADDETIDKEQLKRIHEDLQASDEPLRNFCNANGGKWRGLPLELLLRHGCRYISDWKHPVNPRHVYGLKTPRLLIPCSDSSYLARLTIPIEAFDADERKFVEGKEKLHAGKKTLFNADFLTADEIVFVVESYSDAMSLEYAGFAAVALGAATRGDLLVNAVAKMDKKPQIIILLDSDDAGRKNAPILHNELLNNVDCPCVVRFLTDDNSKIDANEILTTKGKDALSDKLQSIVDDSLSELAAVEAELLAKKEQRLADDDLNFFFSGNTSDLQFAYRLERFCGDRVRWLDDEKWLTYSNGVWTSRTDKNSCVGAFARELAETLREFADGDDEQELAATFQSSKKIGSSINLLKTCDSIRITADDLDSHKELLNCLNCVVDLSSGKTYQHDSSLLITQQCRAIFDANAHSDIVDKFFLDIQPDEETRRGLLRWLAYNLTAETSEEKFMVWHGGGANGKGVLSGTILELFGTYGVGLNPRALLKSNRPVDADKATTAINSLESVRFAISEEVPSDGELDSSLIKNLTGGDKISIRHNYGEYRTIKNHAKINISGNYLPRLESVADGGILRRLLNMPFTVKFGTSERPADIHLKQKMLTQESLNALLAILVREAVAWYRGDGLIISPLMTKETKQHLRQSDFVSDFIADNFVLQAGLEINAKILLDALKSEYPYESARFKRADLIKLVCNVGGITYGEDRNRNRIFKGVGKIFISPRQQLDDFNGEPINQSDIPFDEV